MLQLCSSRDQNAQYLISHISVYSGPAPAVLSKFYVEFAVNCVNFNLHSSLVRRSFVVVVVVFAYLRSSFD